MLKNADKMKKVKTEADPSIKDKVAKQIAEGIVGVQVHLSRRLSAWERKIGTAQKKILFLVFATMTGAYCSYVLLDALLREDRIPARQLREYRLSVPVDSIIKDAVPLKIPEVIREIKPIK